MWKYTRKQIEKMLLSRNMWKSDIANNLMATKPSTASSKGVNKFNCRYCEDKNPTCEVCHSMKFNPTPPKNKIGLLESVPGVKDEVIICDKIHELVHQVNYLSSQIK